jgi:hypothetical protein
VSIGCVETLFSGEIEFILSSFNHLSNYLFCYHVLIVSFSLFIIDTISHVQWEAILHCSDQLEYIGSHLIVAPGNVYVASWDELMDIAVVLACFD